ncbi:uncharacterized protein LOC112092803 [Morus notabilis]|uniref:uncharacterized protein LOC112092803 n=1 Tax=Morus notabilis TaxID=981085 RepID=UPI000CECEB7B|nr:uncharacterized protein LOC112092803 [Morus notabilis]
MDLDLILRVDQHAALTDKSTSDDKREMEKWERPNCISLIVMKRAIPKAFRSTMSDKVTMAMGFLEDLKKSRKKSLTEARLGEQGTNPTLQDMESSTDAELAESSSGIGFLAGKVLEDRREG